MNSILSNVAVQWLVRRVPDWGGWIGTFAMAVVGFYSTLTPGNQEIVNSLISGNWQNITLGALLPFVVLIYSQVISFKKTVQPQVVQTIDGTTVTTPLKEVPGELRMTVKEVTPIPRKRTLLDILLGK